MPERISMEMEMSLRFTINKPSFVPDPCRFRTNPTPPTACSESAWWVWE